MSEDERTGPEAETRSGRRRRRVTGLADLLPDWILPPASKAHLRSARREMLLAGRGVLDAWIDCLDEAEPARRTPTRIEIQ